MSLGRSDFITNRSSLDPPTEHPELQDVPFEFDGGKTTDEQEEANLEGLLGDCQVKLRAAKDTRKSKIEEREEAQRSADAAVTAVKRKEEQRRRQREQRLQAEMQRKEEQRIEQEERLEAERQAEAEEMILKSEEDEEDRTSDTEVPEETRHRRREHIQTKLSEQDKHTDGTSKQETRHVRKGRKSADFYFPQSQDEEFGDETPAKPQTLLPAFSKASKFASPRQACIATTPLSQDKRVRWEDQDDDLDDGMSDQGISLDSIFNSTEQNPPSSSRTYGSSKKGLAAITGRRKSSVGAIQKLDVKGATDDHLDSSDAEKNSGTPASAQLDSKELDHRPGTGSNTYEKFKAAPKSRDPVRTLRAASSGRSKKTYGQANGGGDRRPDKPFELDSKPKRSEPPKLGESDNRGKERLSHTYVREQTGKSDEERRKSSKGAVDDVGQDRYKLSKEITDGHSDKHVSIEGTSTKSKRRERSNSNGRLKDISNEKEGRLSNANQLRKKRVRSSNTEGEISMRSTSSNASFNLSTALSSTSGQVGVLDLEPKEIKKHRTEGVMTLGRSSREKEMNKTSIHSSTPGEKKISDRKKTSPLTSRPEKATSGRSKSDSISRDKSISNHKSSMAKAKSNRGISSSSGSKEKSSSDRTSSGAAHPSRRSSSSVNSTSASSKVKLTSDRITSSVADPSRRASGSVNFTSGSSKVKSASDRRSSGSVNSTSGSSKVKSASDRRSSSSVNSILGSSKVKSSSDRKSSSSANATSESLKMTSKGSRP